MPFLDRENSNYSGEPVALYEFRRGTVGRYYASCDTDILAGGQTYYSTAIKDAGISQKGTSVTDVFEMTAPADLDVATWYRGIPPSDTVYVIVRRFHYGDTDSVIMWLGQVVAVELNPDETCKISAQAVSISLKRGGLRLSWQRGCPHALYDQNCMVDRSAYKHGVTVTSLNRVALIIDQPALLATGFWPGGIIEWDAGQGLTERRMIEAVETGGSGAIYPLGYTDAFSVGQQLTIYPGCKRTSQWCDEFFNNELNYGGFSYMPTRTPYDGDPVF